MYLHIEFKDGSNPYIYYGKHFDATEKDIAKELKKWKKNFYLELLSQDDKGKNYLATEKRVVALEKADLLEKATKNLEYCYSHNKNYTNKQYYAIEDTLDEVKRLRDIAIIEALGG